MCVAIYGSAFLGITTYGYIAQNYYVSLFFDTNKDILIIKSVFVIYLLAYIFVKRFRVSVTKNLMILLGFSFLTLSLSSFYYSSITLLQGYTVLLGDSFGLFEGGTLALILGLELDYKKLSFNTNYLNSISYPLRFNPRIAKRVALNANMVSK